MSNQASGVNARSINPQYSFIVLDVDGTLLTSSKVVTKPVFNAIQELEQTGKYKFCLASGRSRYALQKIAEELHIQPYLIGYGGATLILPNSKDPEFEHRLSQPNITTIVELARKRQTSIYLYSQTIIHYEQHIKETLWQLKDELPIVRTQDCLLSRDAVLKISIYSQSQILLELRDLIQNHITDISTSFPQPYLLDITHPGADKGSALTFLAEKIGVPLENIAAIGDSENDLPLFKLVGLSVAMGNGSPVIQGNADWIAPTNDEDGVAWALEKIRIESKPHDQPQIIR